MENYICKKQFDVPYLDENELYLSDEILEVEKGSVWTICDKSYISDFRLEDKNGNYLELPKKSLELYFDKL